jgi:polyribonucleotide nucleotidyltransferase
MEDSQLDLVIAGTADAVLMIEGFCDFLNEAQMLQAIEAGHAAIGIACGAIAEWCAGSVTLGRRTCLTRPVACRAARVGKPKDLSRIVQPTPGLHEAVSGIAAVDLDAAVRMLTKQERQQAMSLVDARVHAALSSQARPSVLHMTCHRRLL